MADKFTVGLVQMRCTTDKDDNLTRAEGRIREAAARGAQIVCLHELFAVEYFAERKTPHFLILLNRYRGRRQTGWRRWRKIGRSLWWSRCLNGARQAFTTTLVRFWTPTDRTWANTGKCIFRMIHCITKSFILRQAIWAS